MSSICGQGSGCTRHKQRLVACYITRCLAIITRPEHACFGHIGSAMWTSSTLSYSTTPSYHLTFFPSRVKWNTYESDQNQREVHDSIMPSVSRVLMTQIVVSTWLPSYGFKDFNNLAANWSIRASARHKWMWCGLQNNAQPCEWALVEWPHFCSDLIVHETKTWVLVTC